MQVVRIHAEPRLPQGLQLVNHQRISNGAAQAAPYVPTQRRGEQGVCNQKLHG